MRKCEVGSLKCEKRVGGVISDFTLLSSNFFVEVRGYEV